MALNIPGVPFKLTPEDMGMFDPISAMQKGMQLPRSYQDLIQAQLANQKMKTLMPFVQPMAQAELQGAQLGNVSKGLDIQKMQLGMPYVTQQIESGLNLQQAQAKEQEALAKWHEAEAQNAPNKAQAEIDYKKAQTQVEQAKAKAYQDALSETPQSDSTYGGTLSKSYVDQNIAANNGTYVPGWEPPKSASQAPPQPQAQSVYGVQYPVMTQEDKRNKLLFGMDTYGPKLTQFQQQTQDQKNQLLKSSMESSKQLQGINDFMDKYNEYDQLMNTALQAGKAMGHTPDWMTIGEGARINDLVNQMSIGGITQLKEAMGNARFAIPEFNAALKMKPQRTWNKLERDRYGKFLYATKARIDEISKMKQIALNNPNLGVSSADLDAIIATYQDKYPITFREGPHKGEVNFNALGHWPEFLKPDAINAIKNGIDYKPKESDKSQTTKVIRDSSGKLVAA